MMTQCSEHVDYQLPKTLTRINFLLDGVECKVPGQNKAIAMVKGDKGPTRKINKFEYAAAYLTPWDPVTKSHNTNRKCGAAEMWYR